ncbi:SMP-30/gluconolactonase/LRE family protein [Sphaerisporangium sp. NPDC051017]|uniref:SMP-30/gluconolactonase/LRE family protein n=1 Tax=Sphaerisporangium sp. NPDC051017 TaxID=3154636 RepID=UPI00342E9086
MASYELQTLATGGAYFEAPRWHDGLWWVSDLYRKGIFTYTSEGKEEQVVALEHQPSGLGFMPDGSLLYVSQEDHRIYRRAADGTTTLHADVSEHCRGDLNDLVVDERGYAYAGFFGFDPFAGEPPAKAAVIGIDPEGDHRVLARDMVFPNGSVITADGRTLIVGEGLAGRYTAFPIQADGSLGERRVWAELSKAPDFSSFDALMAGLDLILDGCCLDAEGLIWAADPQNARVIRVREGGEIVEEIKAPEGQNIFACMLGGFDGRTLLLCIAPGLVDNDRLGGLAATLQTTRVEVPHAGRP